MPSCSCTAVPQSLFFEIELCVETARPMNRSLEHQPFNYLRSVLRRERIAQRLSASSFRTKTCGEWRGLYLCVNVWSGMNFKDVLETNCKFFRYMRTKCFRTVTVLSQWELFKLSTGIERSKQKRHMCVSVRVYVCACVCACICVYVCVRVCMHDRGVSATTLLTIHVRKEKKMVHEPGIEPMIS